MKKLVVLFSLLFALSLQAANLDWQYFRPGTSDSLSGDGLSDPTSFGVGCTALLFVTTDSSITRSALLTQIQGNSYSGSFTTFEGEVIDNGKGLYVMTPKSDASGYTNYVATGLTSGTYYCYLAVFNTTSTPADGDYFMLTEQLEATTYESNTEQYTSAKFTTMPAGWTKIGTVPEPTVLALLALGVAGLALRRRA